MTTPWARITEKDYETWLGNRQVTIDEFNGWSCSQRNQARTEFERQQQQQQPPEHQPRPVVPEECRPALDFAKQQIMQAQTTEVRSMSKATFDFARELLKGMDIQIRTEGVCLEKGSTTDPAPYAWTVMETMPNQTVRPGEEHNLTHGAKGWLKGNFLVNDKVLDLKVVTGPSLPVLKANRKESRGQGDLLVIGKKCELEVAATDDAYDFALGLIELKHDNYLIKKAQNVLGLASVCKISRVGRNCALLATDCNSKWELYFFNIRIRLSVEFINMAANAGKALRNCWMKRRRKLSNRVQK